MTDPLPLPTRRILDTLLDRYEQPNRLRVVRVRLAVDTDGEYFSAHDVAPRTQTNDALKALAARGVLRLHWQQWEEDNWLAAVDLIAEEAPQLYALLKRTRHADQSDALQMHLGAQTSCPGWHAAFLSHALAQLAARRSVAPLVLGDEAWNRDLLRALDALAHLERPTLERTLSVQLFNDSKRMAALRGGILSVLRRQDPAAPGYADDEWALLRAHHLDRVPEYVPLAGPLRLRTGAVGMPDQLLDLSPFQPGVALSAATLQDAGVESCTATTVLTVENATSFSELAAIRPGWLLAIYTGGFASPTVTTLLRRLREHQPLQRFYHWGDLDAGGFRILAHLRSAAGAITPIAMDAATFDAFHMHAQPLSEAESAALRGLQSYPLLADCAPVLAHLIAAGLKLEQEAVEAREVLRRLELDR
jgi:Uncharacterized protein conserved in bacteria C-term(DUF2220)